MKKIFTILFVSLFILGCGQNLDDLQKENQELKTQIERLLTGDIYYLQESDQPLNDLQTENQELQAKIEKLLTDNTYYLQEKRSMLQANATTDGIWTILYHKDSFGDYTDVGYVSTVYYIKGTFSNPVVVNETLYPHFFITNKEDISIALLEYGANPVQGYPEFPDYYKVDIKDDKGNIHSLQAINTSDRLSFSKEDSVRLHNLLKQSTSLKFSIIVTSGMSVNNRNSYVFAIENTAGYEETYSSLSK